MENVNLVATEEEQKGGLVPTVAFSGITYEIHKNKTTKTVLQDVSGCFYEGQMAALMGPSGAGKTTLLNCIAGRIPARSNLKGTIIVEGTQALLFKPRKFGFVSQDDLLLPNLTVREHVTFYAKLRLQHLSAQRIDEKVTSTLQALELSACSDTRVGAPGIVRGVSGGERKRVAIACELVTAPRILLLDEPTSGLDSETALTVIRLLRKVATTSHTTVICTIHQPSAECFQMFDRLLMLSSGYVTYAGPVSSLSVRLQSIGYPCPPYSNPAEHILKLSTNSNTADALRHAQVLKSNSSNSMGSVSTSIDDDGSNFDIKQIADSVSRWFVTLLVLMHRHCLNLVREKRQTVMKLMEYLTIAVFTGLIFLRVGTDQRGVQDRNGVLFFVTIYQAYVAMNSMLLLFPEERPILLREYAKGLYSIGGYFVAKNFVELPLQIFFPAFSSAVCYYMVGLRAAFDHFIIFILFTVLVALAAFGIGMLVGAISNNATEALSLGPIVMIPMMIFGGLFLNADNVPKYLIWLERVSFFKYGYMGLMRNEHLGATYYCKSDQYGANGTCPFTTGEQVLAAFSFDRFAIWKCALVLIALIIGIRLLAFTAMLIVARRAKLNV